MKNWNFLGIFRSSFQTKCKHPKKKKINKYKQRLPSSRISCNSTKILNRRIRRRQNPKINTPLDSSKICKRRRSLRHRADRPRRRFLKWTRRRNHRHVVNLFSQIYNNRIKQQPRCWIVTKMPKQLTKSKLPKEKKIIKIEIQLVRSNKDSSFI